MPYKDSNEYSLPFTPTVGRVEPPYLKRAKRLEPTTPASLEPRPEINTLFDDEAREKILAEGLAAGEIPEVVPAFAGLRKVITAARINHLQGRAESLAKTGEIRRFVGEAIFSSTAYGSVYDPYHEGDTKPGPNRRRPTGLRNQIAVGTMEKVHDIHVRSNMRKRNLTSKHPEIEDSRQTFRPFYAQYDRSRKHTWGERRAMGRDARHYRRNNRISKFTGKTVEHLGTAKLGRAERSIKKRDDLVLRHAALKDQAAINKETWKERRKKTKNMSIAAAKTLHRKTRVGGSKVKKIGGNAGSAAKKGVHKTGSVAKNGINKLRRK